MMGRLHNWAFPFVGIERGIPEEVTNARRARDPARGVARPDRRRALHPQAALSDSRERRPSAAPLEQRYPSGSPRLTRLPWAAGAALLSMKDALQAKKSVTILPVGNDLLRWSDPSVDGIIRDQLLKQYSSVEDYYFLLGNGAVNTPKGIRNLAGTINTATLSYSAATVLADLRGLIALLEDASVPMISPVWFCSPKTRQFLTTAVDSVGALQFPTMADGKLLGYPIESTTNISSTMGSSNNQSEIYLIDMDSFIVGTAYIDLDLQGSATYHDDSGNHLSAWDRDESVIKLVVGVDCALKHSAAAAVLTQVPYGN